MWSIDYPEYTPVEFTAESVKKQPIWADPPKADKITHWNKIDKDFMVNRKSHNGKYKLIEGIPQNPRGRTGIKGRGLLGRWGPNHAADPIVTK